jgi:predicted amidohydrolase
MKVTEFDDFPVKYDRFVIYPEYYTTYKKAIKTTYSDRLIKSGETEIIGIGKSYGIHTSVIILNNRQIIGIRNKISIFTGEDSSISTRLESFDLGDWRIGIVICREVLHTAIAEIYRMMKVNLLTVHIGGGEFYNLQRASWIDQMCLFSDIVGCPLVCASGADRAGGGINLLIER